MAGLLDENFDGYNDGDLNGQGGWSGDVLFDIQSTVKQAGTKAVKIVTPVDAVTKTIQKSFTPFKDGIVAIYVRKENALSTYGFSYGRIYSGANRLCFFTHRQEFILFYWYGGSFDTLILTPANATWYKIEFEFRSSDGYCRARIDGGTWTEWRQPENSYSVVDTVMLAAKGTASYANTTYYDTISVTATAIVKTLTNEVLKLADTKSTVHTYGKTITEVIKLVGSAVHVATMHRTFTEVIKIVGSKSIKPIKSVSEAIKLTEGFAKVGTLIRTLTETIKIADAIEESLLYLKEVSDSIKIAEGISKKAGVAVSEAIKLAETFTRFSIHTFTDTIKLADAISKITSYTKTVSDTIKITGTLAKTVGKNLTETLKISDSISFVKNFIRTLTEEIKLADAVSTLQKKIISVSDTLKLAETFAKSTIKNFNETLKISEYFSRQWTLVRTFAETIKLSEAGWSWAIMDQTWDDYTENWDFYGKGFITVHTHGRTYTDIIKLADAILGRIKKIIEGLSMKIGSILFSGSVGNENLNGSISGEKSVGKISDEKLKGKTSEDKLFGKINNS